jgi:shikimate O-hydroxycinnamoyltransferase
VKVENFLVRAEDRVNQIVTCSIFDRLIQNLPVSVVFFYRKSIESDVLVNSLKKVLSDFPIFAGTLKNINNDLCIDCNNRGILFSVVRADLTIERILDEFPRIEKQKLVDLINPKQAISSQSPVMTVKLTYSACGGMVMGICWHHSIGDMHTFMQLMKAWSSLTNQQEYVVPIIPHDRDKYLQDKLEPNDRAISGVRYLSVRESLELGLYMLFKARNKIVLQFYFSASELTNMKQELSEKADKKLSKNDVLCSHLFEIISKLDGDNRAKCLAIVVNYRSRLELPQNILGNFFSLLNVSTSKQVDPVRLSKNIRGAIDNFQLLHMDFFATKNYINENGGIEKIDRFMIKDIDPIKKTLAVTNWANFSVYNIRFGESQPFYFTPLNDRPFPWLSVISEGFDNGLIYSVVLPSKLAKNLIRYDNLQKIHRYRDRQEVMPELVEKLAWLL